MFVAPMHPDKIRASFITTLLEKRIYSVSRIGSRLYRGFILPASWRVIQIVSKSA